MLTEFRATPHRHEGERLTIGQIQTFHAQHVVGTQDRLHASRRLLEGELQDAALGSNATVGQLRFDGGQPAETLTQRCRGHEPSETLACVHQTFVAQHLERATHGHAAS